MAAEGIRLAMDRVSPMIRRLLTLLLAIALLPVTIPSGSAGSLASRGHGTTAERPASHGAIASLSESWARIGSPARAAHRQEAASRGALGATWHLALVARQTSRPHRKSTNLHRQGATLIPLRI